MCVGNEWHRFPSAFFLPSPRYRLAFVESGFGGLLPTDFNASRVRWAFDTHAKHVGLVTGV